MLDIGCGEGELIACLCNAAPWLPLRSAAYAGILGDNCPYPEGVESEEGINEADDFLHVRRVAALDVSLADLKLAIEATKPMVPMPSCQTCPSEYTGLRESVRWEPLAVNVWHGGLEVHNPNFINMECIVSTEV